MPVDETLSTFCDYAFTTAVAIYVLAMIFFLAEQAGRIGSRAEAAQPAKELVGAGGPDVGSTTATTEPPAGESGEPRRSRQERFGRMAVALTVLGAVVHLASIVLRGFAVSRWPLGNMYEYVSFITLVTVTTSLVMMWRFGARRIGAFVLVPVVILMFLGGTVLYAVAAPVQPALQSYWLVIHVTIISSSSGLLLLPGVASLAYLVRTANERNPDRFARFAPRLPRTDVLDRVAYRTTVFAFPLYTLGIICGAIWAESAWGRFWGWDPKETTALVAWVVYAAYLHSRATAGWRGQGAAWINTLGAAVTVFNLFFVNLVTTGLHSYAGLG
jgi:cytochrome c-type biogenesis protein CcsB